MYVQGNLAVKTKTNPPPQRYKEQKRTIKKKAVIPTGEKLLYLVAVAICVLLAGSVIYHYAQIYEVNAKMQRVEKEIKAIEDENANLKLEVNKQSDPKLLIEKAKLLGLEPSEEKDIREIPHKTALSSHGAVALSR